ncbi:unnamed protein product [Aureobasidium pullulans]|nr:unnamed protein product [Aureobasidium pullulans]
MGKSEIRYAAKVDLEKDAASQPQLHIKNTDDADDIKNVDLTKIHYLSGPFEIENAEPGDVLVVEIQDVQPLQEQPWGFTGIFAKENGGGFLDELYPDAAKAIWDFEGIFCSSRHIPHVRFPGLIHPGILGCAPSAEILTEWNRRENQLISECAHMNRDVAQPPNPTNVHAGSADEQLKKKFKVMKNGVEQLAMKSPIYIPGPVEPNFGPGRHIYFEGFSVDSEGKQHFLDTTIPNACTTLGLPIDIFDFDIRPEAPVQKLDMGTCAFVTKK